MMSYDRSLKSMSLFFSDANEDPSVNVIDKNGDDTNSCEPSITVSNVGNVCRGQTIFNENFNTSSLDKKFWNVEQRYADEPVSIYNCLIAFERCNSRK